MKHKPQPAAEVVSKWQGWTLEVRQGGKGKWWWVLRYEGRRTAYAMPSAGTHSRSVAITDGKVLIQALRDAEGCQKAIQAREKMRVALDGLSLEVDELTRIGSKQSQALFEMSEDAAAAQRKADKRYKDFRVNMCVLLVGASMMAWVVGCIWGWPA